MEKTRSAILRSALREVMEDGKDRKIPEMKEDVLIQKGLPDSSVLTQKRIDVMNSRPQLLMTVLKPYETNGYEERLAGEFMKMGGTEYSDGFILGPNYQTSYAIFNLNGQYTEMSGMIGHVDGSGNSSEAVTIFADGAHVKTIEIDYKALPQDFSIDVTGVRQLIVERTEGNTETGLAELIIH